MHFLRENSSMHKCVSVLEGKKVLVLGSAPSPTIPSDYDNTWKLVCVNASGVVAREKGLLPPDITIISVGALTKNRGTSVEKRDVMRGLRGGLTIVRTISKDFWTRLYKMLRARLVLRSIAYEATEMYELDRSCWTQIIVDLLGEDVALAGNISTGVFSVMLALHCRAREVVVSGINPSIDGHEYSLSGFKRQHSVSDRAALDWLVANRSVRVL